MQFGFFEGALGGIGLFLLGMRLLSQGICSVTDSRIRDVSSFLTSNRFYSLLTGALLSVAVSSGSASLLIVIALLNGGTLTPFQACNVIGGILLGSSLVLYVDVIPYYVAASPLIFLGITFKLWARRRRLASAGDLVLGAGLLFMGLSLLEYGFRPMENHPFYGLLDTPFFHHEVPAALVGAVIAFLVQSARSAVGIAESLSAVHGLSVPSACSMVLGGGVGIGLMGVLASSAGNRAARKVAVICLGVASAVSVVGVLLITLVPPVSRLAVSAVSAGSLHGVLLWVYSLASLTVAAVMLAASGLLARTTHLNHELLPDGSAPQPCAGYLDSRILNTPALAVEQARKETVRMMSVASYMFADVRELLFEYDARRAETIRRHEQVLDSLNHEISDFLAALSRSAGEALTREIPGLFQTVSDLEHVGDRCEEILDLVVARKEAGILFSEDAMDDLRRFCGAVGGIVEQVNGSYQGGGRISIGELRSAKAEVRALHDEIRKRHFERIGSGVCLPRAALMYNDIIFTLGAISDQFMNIATASSRGGQA